MKITHKTIQGAINFHQNKLIKKAKKSGLYENFGQDVVRAIEDNFIDVSDDSDEMNRKRAMVSNFDDWAMNFDLSQL